MGSTEATYDPDAPNLVANVNGEVVGAAVKWNEHGLGECIVQFFDGSADSAIFQELRFVNGQEQARQYLNRKES